MMEFRANTVRALSLAAIVILFSSLVSLGGPLPASGTLIDDLRKEIADKEKKIKELEAKTNSYKTEIQRHEKEALTLAGQIAIIDARIRKLSVDISLTKGRVEQSSLQIRELGIEIEQQEAEIRKHKIFLGEVIRTIHFQDEHSVLAVMLAEPTLSSLFNQVQYTQNLQSQLQEELDIVRQLKKGLEQERRLQEEKRADLESLKNQLIAQRSAQGIQRSERRDILTETRNQERRFQKLLKDVKRQQREIAIEIFELEDKLRRAIDPSSVPGAGAGILSWPNEGILTQRYGPTSKTGFVNNVYNFHNGIDIASGYGSSIRAARAGKVIATGNDGRYAYGRWIAIQHDNGLTTLYGHLSSIGVASGQFVKRGEVIGLEGSTGFSTGSHVHFTVYETSSFRVIQRFYGPLPIGASLDPMKYLP